jgi:hypothetical protein
MALLHGLGLPLVTAGWLISTLAMAALPGTVYLLSRTLGGQLLPSSVAAAAALIHPDLFGFAHQVQPDALSTLLFTTLAILCLRSERTTWAAVLGGFTLLFRESGAALWPALIVLLWRRSDSHRARAATLLILVTIGWIGPLVVGQTPGAHPLDAPWSDRAGGAIQAFLATDPGDLPFLRELNREDRAAYVELVLDRDRLGQLGWHVHKSLSQAWDLWCLLGIACLLAIRSARAGNREPLWTALLLSAALPALLIWSQSRHVAMLLPIALAITSACWPPTRTQRVWVAAALAALLIPWPGRLRTLHEGQHGATLRAQNLAELGEWICAQAPKGALLGGFMQDIGLYCPLPRHDPDESSADWRTFLVTDRPPPSSTLGIWEQVYGEGGPLQIYQLDPARQPRPCQDATIPPETPHLAIGRATAQIDC